MRVAVAIPWANLPQGIVLGWTPYHSCSDGKPHGPGNTILVMPDFVRFSYDILWPVACFFQFRCVASHHAKVAFVSGSQPSLATCKGATL